jgi:hypothetical protein
MNGTILFEQKNEPNAAKLIESLRCLGYDNYVAAADIVDNSLDADAESIKVRIWTEEGEVHLTIVDNGTGMDQDILDQALRLGSLTPKNPISDLGKFGMGLVTAGLSLARQTTVITRQGDTFLTSIVDVDEVIRRNAFCKYLGRATEEQRKLFELVNPGVQSGTLVRFDKCDGIRNRNTTLFANTLRKHLGRIHRYFIKAGKRIVVNDEDAVVVDPLELNSEGTEIFSDEEYPITSKIDGREREDMVRIRIALIPENVAGGEHDVALGIKNQGFYIMRNNREIKAAETLDAFTKHNDFNRMRGEVFLTGDLDIVVGIDFTKREVVFDQSFKDQLLAHLKAQCTTIKRKESGRTRVKESEEITGLHHQAEKFIDQKAKLLVTPKTHIEKRGPRTERNPTVSVPALEKRIRKHLQETQEGRARRCKFEYAKLGPHGQIYECDLYGSTIVIRWNIEHPFYQRFILDQRSDGRLVTAVDYLIYSMASAELMTLSEDSHEVLNSYKAIVSSNVRTLLA